MVNGYLRQADNNPSPNPPRAYGGYIYLLPTRLMTMHSLLKSSKAHSYVLIANDLSQTVLLNRK